MPLADMSEKALKEQVLKWTKRHRPDVWLYKTADLWKSGIPDIVGCAKGQFFAVELKTPVGRVTKLQIKTLEAIKQSGGKAKVVRTLPQWISFLEGLDNAFEMD